MNKIILAISLLTSLNVFSQEKTFTEKLEGIKTSSKELTKSVSTDNSSVGQSGVMSTTVPLVTVSSKTMTFPLQLDYTSGITANQTSGPVGLGWNMSSGSIVRDFGAFEPDYSSTMHEGDMLNVNVNSDTPNGWLNPSDNGGINPFAHNQVLGYDIVPVGGRPIPLSDFYRINVPGLGSNSFWNGGQIGGAHNWKLTEYENWKIEHSVKTYTIDQEYSRINEVNLAIIANNDGFNLGSSHAAAIGVLPYVINGSAGGFDPTTVTKVLYEDFKEFIITTDDGTKYVFGRALRGQKYVFDNDPYWSSKISSMEHPANGSYWKIDYIAEWLLTEIRSVDYVDANNNGIADDGDYGDWIRFDYTDETQNVETVPLSPGSRFNSNVPKHREWSSYSQTDQASSLMRERAYLTHIVTPTQNLDFTISQRFDVEHDYYNKPANKVGNQYFFENRKFGSNNGSISDFDILYPVETMKYDGIKVYSKLLDKTLYPTENLLVQSVVLNYAQKGSPQELAVSEYLIRNNNNTPKLADDGINVLGSPSNGGDFDIEKYKNTTDKRGKTTLLSIDLYGGKTIAGEKTSYIFEYAYNPSFNEIHKREIIRKWSSPSVRQGSNTQNVPFANTKAYYSIPSYKEEVLGSNGFPPLNSPTITRTDISTDNFHIDIPYQENHYKSSFGSMSDLENYLSAHGQYSVGEYATPIEHYLRPIVDAFGFLYADNCSQCPKAWSLTKITYPTGGEISYEYEQGTFITTNQEKENWSFDETEIPIIKEYNELAKKRSYVQDTYNQYATYHNLPSLGGLRKTLTATFEVNLPSNYGIRLKSKTINDRVNPLVTINYTYQNGHFTSLPSQYLQTVIGSFNQFIIREKQRHVWEESYYGPEFEWITDFEGKMKYVSITGFALDEYTSTHFYEKIDQKNADNSFVRTHYGPISSTDAVVYQPHSLYCYKIPFDGNDGSYIIAPKLLNVHPVYPEKVEYYDASSTIPYKSITSTYEVSIPLFSYDFKVDYTGGLTNANNNVNLWDNIFEIWSLTSIPNYTKFAYIADYYIPSSLILPYNGETGDNAYAYQRWASFKTQLIHTQTIYKGIESTKTYTYDIGDYTLVQEENNYPSLNKKYITTYEYAHNTYSYLTQKFQNLNLKKVPTRTNTYLNTVSATTALSATMATFDYSFAVPKPKNNFVYETSDVDENTGVFTLVDFNIYSSTNPNWRIDQNTNIEYNKNGNLISSKTNRLYNKMVYGNNLNGTKATFSYPESKFDATYSGFEDYFGIHGTPDWNTQEYKNETWFSTPVQQTIQPVLTYSDYNTCGNNSSFTFSPNGGYQVFTYYHIVTINDISNLQIEQPITVIFNSTTYNTTISNIIAKTDLIANGYFVDPSAQNYILCFSTPITFNMSDPNGQTFTLNLNYSTVDYALSKSYARTGEYSYKLPTKRVENSTFNKTPLRPVKIIPRWSFDCVELEERNNVLKNLVTEIKESTVNIIDREQLRNTEVLLMKIYEVMQTKTQDSKQLEAIVAQVDENLVNRAFEAVFQKDPASNPSGVVVADQCNWVYEASVWLKYDLDNPKLQKEGANADLQKSMDFTGDVKYLRGTVTETNNGSLVKIICDIYNSTRTILLEQRVFYVEGLDAQWRQFTVDVAVLKNANTWLDVYIVNEISQIGQPGITLKSVFADDIAVYPKGAKYNYSVINKFGAPTFKVDNNDVYTETVYDAKARPVSAINQYGTTTNQFEYFEKPNWNNQQNHITQRNWIDNGVYNETRTYIDGFGKTKQVMSSDLTRGTRIVSETNVFNNKGQVVQSYKPYVLYNPNLTARYDQNYIAKTQEFYGSNFAYAQAMYEAKPESILSSYSEPRLNTETAITSTQSEYVYSAGIINPHNVSQFYSANALMVHQLIKANGNITRTYMDNIGRVVMEEHQIGNDHIQNGDGSISLITSPDVYAQTWYLYDDAGRLTHIWDPEGKESIYTYNSLGILIKSKTPDKGTSELRYDKYGQVRFVRNEKDNQAVENSIYGMDQFKYSKYDVWGRVIESGMLVTAPNTPGLNVGTTQIYFDNLTFINNQEFPTATQKFVQLHSKNTYDGSRDLFNSDKLISETSFSGHVLISTYTYAPSSTDKKYYEYMADGQLAKLGSEYNGLAGIHNIEPIYNAYRIPVGKKYIHPTQSNYNFIWNSELDNFGRLKESSSTHNGVTTKTGEYYYDVFGNLLMQGLGSTGNTADPHIDYVVNKQNIRNQVINQMTKNLRIGLTHDLVGNITNQYWSNEHFDPTTGSTINVNQYEYSYDKMNRLIGADYKTGVYTQNPFAYFEDVSADLPNDFNIGVHEQLYLKKVKPILNELNKLLKNSKQAELARKTISTLSVFQVEYFNNNVSFETMTQEEQEVFLQVYLEKAALNKTSPVYFEQYMAEKNMDVAYLELLKTQESEITNLKYLKDLLSNTTTYSLQYYYPNSSATVYGNLPDFQLPETTSNVLPYDEAFWYSKNGNIDRLNRNDDFGVKTQQMYSYSNPLNNQLTDVTWTNMSTAGVASHTYQYDMTGNLLYDSRNGVTDISYISYNDMPQSITNGSGTKLYRYDNAGQRIVKYNSSSDIEFYIDKVILDGSGNVKSYQTVEGYAVPLPTGTSVGYFYNLKDWLGTNRVVLDVNGTILNVSDHYAYGLKMPARNYSADVEGNRYQFTGHEYDGETNYEYHGARYYNRELGRYMSVDPLATKFTSWSTYNYCMGNPIMLIDPDGKSPQDWILKKNGTIYWDKNANSQETTKKDQIYLGKELEFKFNSYIDASLWDGPGGSIAAGDKMTSTIKLKASENEKGELTDISASFEVKLGDTPVGAPRAYYPGEGGQDQRRDAELTKSNDGTIESFKIVFEQHASVSSIEESGLRMLGYKIVDVAQKLVISQNKNYMWVGSYTNIFPSATLSVNGHQLMHYAQPSFKATHKAPTKATFLPPFYEYNFSYYPSIFYKR